MYVYVIYIYIDTPGCAQDRKQSIDVTHTHTRVYTRIYVCSYACIPVDVYICISVCIYASGPIHARTHMRIVNMSTRSPTVPLISRLGGWPGQAPAACAPRRRGRPRPERGAGPEHPRVSPGGRAKPGRRRVPLLGRAPPNFPETLAARMRGGGRRGGASRAATAASRASLLPRCMVAMACMDLASFGRHQTCSASAKRAASAPCGVQKGGKP